MRALARRLAVLALALPMAAQAAGFVEGKDYEVVPKPVDTSSVDGVLVEEVFGYWCPHCKQFDPVVAKWAEALPDDVVFRRLPVTFGRSPVYSAAYFAAKRLAILDKTQSAVFTAIHDRGLHLDRAPQMAALFNEASGIMPDLALVTLTSPAVQKQIETADLRAKNYGATTVPTMIVGGRYRVSISPSLTSFDQLLACVDELVAKLRAEQAAKAD